MVEFGDSTPYHESDREEFAGFCADDVTFAKEGIEMPPDLEIHRSSKRLAEMIQL